MTVGITRYYINPLNKPHVSAIVALDNFNIRSNHYAILLK